jgi:hypothetical protein
MFASLHSTQDDTNLLLKLAEILKSQCLHLDIVW